MPLKPLLQPSASEADRSGLLERAGTVRDLSAVGRRSGDRVPEGFERTARTRYEVVARPDGEEEDMSELPSASLFCRNTSGPSGSPTLRCLGTAICIALFLLLYPISTGSDAHELRSADSTRHFGAFYFSAFWNRVACVDITADAEVGDEGVEAHVEDAVMARLVTVWRREMPEIRAERGLNPRAMTKRSEEMAKEQKRIEEMPKKAKTIEEAKELVKELLKELLKEPSSQKIGCGGETDEKLIPKLQIKVFARKITKTGERFYGDLRSSFTVSVSDCQFPIKPKICVNGLTYNTPESEHPHQAVVLPVLGWYTADVGGLGPPKAKIFMNATKEDLTDYAIKAGESAIQELAEKYYDAKAYLREWQRR